MCSKIQLSKEDLKKHKPTREDYLTKTKIPLVVVLDNVTNSYNIGAYIDAKKSLDMRPTLDIDDELLAKAIE